MSDTATKHREKTSSESEVETQEPSLYQVILLNDDYTTMEFVVLVLEQIFQRSREEAAQIMLAVHHQGSGVAGTYTKEIAETKISLVHHIARQNEFPLKCLMEPVP